MSAAPSMLDHALSYTAKGIPVFPCHPDSKRPLAGRDKDADGNPIPRTGGVKKATTDETQIRKWWEKWPNAMIGMPTGSRSGIDVLDIDTKHDGFTHVPDWQSRSPVIVRTASGGAHLYFRSGGDLQNSASLIAPGLDVKVDGGYVIVPPSARADGKVYSWLHGGPTDFEKLPAFPDDLREALRAGAARQAAKRAKVHAERVQSVPGFANLPAAMAALEVECQIMREAVRGTWNPTLYDCALHLGHLVGSGCLDAELVRQRLSECQEWDKDKLRLVAETMDRGIENGMANPDWPQPPMESIAAAHSESNILRFATYLRRSPSPPSNRKKPKPENAKKAAESKSSQQPMPVVDAEPPKPRLVSAPESVQQTIFFDPWERHAVPPFPLDIFPEPLRHYVEVRSALLGSDPSAVAMAALAAFSAATDHRIKVRVQEHGDWMERAALWVLLVGDPSCKKTPVINAATSELEEQDKVLRREYAKALDAWEAKQDRKKEDEPAPPIRHVCNSITIEKLGEILARGDRGLLVKRDELSGWLGAMEKYGRGGADDRSFWLKTFDGGSWTVDRIQRGETFISNASCSILGGIQPEKLMEQKGLTSDGLLQRFLPVIMQPSRMPLDAPPESAFGDYAKLIRELLALTPFDVELTPDARRVMRELHQHVFDLMQEADGIAVGFGSFLGKLEGLSARLALILYLVELKLAPSDVFGHFIEAPTIEKVRLLVVDFLIPHALELYRRLTLGETGSDLIKPIASFILTNKSNSLSSRDLVRNIAGLRGADLSTVQRRLSPLVAGGWLTPVETFPSNRAWTVQPGVAEHFEARRLEEERRKGAVAQLMGSPRRSEVEASHQSPSEPH